MSSNVQERPFHPTPRMPTPSTYTTRTPSQNGGSYNGPPNVPTPFLRHGAHLVPSSSGYAYARLAALQALS